MNERCREMRPRSALISCEPLNYLELGRVCLEHGRYVEAARLFRAAERSSQSNATLHEEAGRHLRDTLTQADERSALWMRDHYLRSRDRALAIAGQHEQWGRVRAAALSRYCAGLCSSLASAQLCHSAPDLLRQAERLIASALESLSAREEGTHRSPSTELQVALLLVQVVQVKNAPQSPTSERIMNNVRDAVAAILVGRDRDLDSKHVRQGRAAVCLWTAHWFKDAELANHALAELRGLGLDGPSLLDEWTKRRARGLEEDVALLDIEDPATLALLSSFEPSRGLPVRLARLAAAALVSLCLYLGIDERALAQATEISSETTSSLSQPSALDSPAARLESQQADSEPETASSARIRRSYPGEYVVLVGDTVVFHSPDLDAALDKRYELAAANGDEPAFVVNPDPPPDEVPFKGRALPEL